MVAQELFDKVLEKMKAFDVRTVMPALRLANSGAIDDVLNINGCAYYQFIPALVEMVKPQQIVELGGAMGVSAIMFMHNLSPKAKMYSVTLPEGGLEFSFLADAYPNLIRIVGNDLDTDIWPEDTDLFATKIWFFDSEHSEKQLRAELETYKMFFKKGAILMFDDIHLPGVETVWNELTYDKVDCTDPLHYSGFGLAII